MRLAALVIATAVAALPAAVARSAPHGQPAQSKLLAARAVSEGNVLSPQGFFDAGGHAFVFFRVKVPGSTSTVFDLAKYSARFNRWTTRQLTSPKVNVVRADAVAIPGTAYFAFATLTRAAGGPLALNVGLIKANTGALAPSTELTAPPPGALPAVRVAAVNANRLLVVFGGSQSGGTAGLQAELMSRGAGWVKQASVPITAEDATDFGVTGGNGRPVVVTWRVLRGSKHVVRTATFDPGSLTFTPAQDVSDPAKEAMLPVRVAVDANAQQLFAGWYSDGAIWQLVGGPGRTLQGETLTGPNASGCCPSVFANPFGAGAAITFQQIVNGKGQAAVSLVTGAGKATSPQILSAPDEDASQTSGAFDRWGNVYVSWTNAVSDTRSVLRLVFKPAGAALFATPFTVATSHGGIPAFTATPSTRGDVLLWGTVATSDTNAALDAVVFDNSPPTLGLSLSRKQLAKRKSILRLRVGCSDAEQRCSGTARLNAAGVVGSAGFTVPGGKTYTIRVHLTRKGKKLLRHRGPLRVAVTAVASDAVGNRATVTRSFKLSPLRSAKSRSRHSRGGGRTTG